MEHDVGLLEVTEDARVGNNYETPTLERLARSLQAYDTAVLRNQTCQDLEVVDACRGTSASSMYTGKFAPYEGSCESDFYGGFPVYYSQQKELYLYAVDKYPQDWPAEALQGLIRWRIVSTSDFNDTTCRYEESNNHHVDFGAYGQPYNCYPSTFCLDEDGQELSRFKVSAISIICNDIVVKASDGHGGDGGGIIGLVVGIGSGILLLLVGGYFWTRRRKERGSTVLPCINAPDDETRKQRASSSKLDGIEAEHRLEQKPMRHDDDDAENDLQKKGEGQKTDGLTSFSTEGSAQSLQTEATESSDEEGRRIVRSTSNNPMEADNAVAFSNSLSAIKEELAAVPRDIRSMVAYLDDYLDANFDLTDVRKAEQCSVISRSSSHDDDSDRPTRNKRRSRSAERRTENEKSNIEGIYRSANRREDMTNTSKSERAIYRSVIRLFNDVDQSNCSRGRSGSIDRRQESAYPLRSSSVNELDSSTTDSKSERSRPRPRSKSITPRDESKVDRDSSPSLKLDARDKVTRSRSLSRSLHNNYDDTPRGKSLNPEDRLIPIAPIKSIAALGTIGRPKSLDDLDASKDSRTVEKQPDGSVLVIQTRMRDDGALVTTTTKYASGVLAKKHGIQVNL